MSQIDKLVTKAFPDELRNVEPIEIDEDALLALTLEKLGLDEPDVPLPEEKKRVFHLHRSWKPAEEKLVEIPLEQIKYRWINRIGAAIAACLVLSCAVYWGGWLLGNLGFGTRARSAGEGNSHPGDAAVVEVTPSPTPPVPPGWGERWYRESAGISSIQGDDLSAKVVTVTGGDSGFSVDVEMNGLSASYYTVTATCSGKEMYCVGRSTEGNILQMTFLSADSFAGMNDCRVTLVFRLVPDLIPKSEVQQDFPELFGFSVNPISQKASLLTDSELAELGETE